jgi:hypothetical protein
MSETLTELLQSASPVSIGLGGDPSPNMKLIIKTMSETSTASSPSVSPQSKECIFRQLGQLALKSKMYSPLWQLPFCSFSSSVSSFVL